MISNADMPAMPVVAANGEVFKGLTKREMIAMQAMQGLIKVYWDDHKDGTSDYPDGKALVKCLSETAVEHADALLAELEKQQ